MTTDQQLIDLIKPIIAAAKAINHRINIAVVNVNRGPLHPNLIFDEDEGAFSQVKVIPIDSEGFIDPEDWPGGFFGERLEAIGLDGAEA